jgi:peptide deformylase
MAVKPIFILSQGEIADTDSLLRQKSEPVRTGDDISSIIQDLRDTLYGCEIAVGLAAIQIGYPKRIFILNLKKSDRSGEKVFINPELTGRDEQIEAGDEVCMSIPNLIGKVYRSAKVTIKYSNETGQRLSELVLGFEARVVQHEMDHLDGVLYTDRMDNLSNLEEVEFFFEENYPLQAKKTV